MTQRRFRVGDIVSYELGRAKIRGKVIEDRGDFGPEDDQIVRIEVRRLWVPEPDRYEVSAKVLRLVRAAPRKQARRARAARES